MTPEQQLAEIKSRLGVPETQGPQVAERIMAEKWHVTITGRDGYYFGFAPNGKRFGQVVVWRDDGGRVQQAWTGTSHATYDEAATECEKVNRPEWYRQ